jgi:hypothetical protein
MPTLKRARGLAPDVVISIPSSTGRSGNKVLGRPKPPNSAELSRALAR